MFQPFAELTNRTPSPAQADNDVKYRKHSPWTAARQKKKTRSVQEDKLGIQRNELPAECFNSPGKVVVISRCCLKVHSSAC
jgi:hypothetical protein